MRDATSLRPRPTRKARPNKPHTPATGYCFVCGDVIVGRSPRALTCEAHKLPSGGGKALVGCPDCGTWHIKFTNTKTDTCPACRVEKTVKSIIDASIFDKVTEAHDHITQHVEFTSLHTMLNVALEHFAQLDPHIQRVLVQGWARRSHDPA